MRISDWSSDVCSSDLMCYWQRWPHQAAMVLAALALLLRRNDAAMRTLTLLAALAIAISGLIGIFHAGVEYGFWEGRSEEHTSELQSLMRISYAVFCLKKKN